MQESLVNSLCAQRRGIHARWEALLRTERVTSALAYPDSMVHLIDWALDQLFAALREPAVRRRAEHSGGRAVTRPECPCGKNPLLAFFRAGEQAMLESLVLEQAAHRPIEPHERDVALNELCYAIRSMERREVEAFCSVCQHHHGPPHPHAHGHALHAEGEASLRSAHHSPGRAEPPPPPVAG
jgi:hypothetical protein